LPCAAVVDHNPACASTAKNRPMKTCPVCNTTFPNELTNCAHDGAMLMGSRDLEPGLVVRSKYRIIRVLGRGGMGTVYLAEHILLGQQRALKFISSELSQDPKFLKRFRLEALAAIQLRHPNIVEVADLDQAEDGSPFIAMEYVEGASLRDALADAPFPIARALSIARGVGLGLIQAHSKKIVHRDIKPENIFLARDAGGQEIPKILDFGIASMKETATAVSRTRGLMLTPEYAAPEQWKGIAAEELDGRVDLYALGGMLHEMLTGSTGLHAHNTEGWMYQHLHGTPEAPSKQRPALAQCKGLDALVLRLLEKDRDKRTESAEAFVRELDAVRSGTPIVSSQRETVREPKGTVPMRATRVDTSVPIPSAPQPSIAQAPTVARAGQSATKFFIGAAIVLVVGIGAYAAWSFFRHSAQPNQMQSNQAESTVPSPTANPASTQPSEKQSSTPTNQPRTPPDAPTHPASQPRVQPTAQPGFAVPASAKWSSNLSGDPEKYMDCQYRLNSNEKAVFEWFDVSFTRYSASSVEVSMEMELRAGLYGMPINERNNSGCSFHEAMKGVFEFGGKSYPVSELASSGCTDDDRTGSKEQMIGFRLKGAADVASIAEKLNTGGSIRFMLTNGPRPGEWVDVPLDGFRQEYAQSSCPFVPLAAK